MIGESGNAGQMPPIVRYLRRGSAWGAGVSYGLFLAVISVEAAPPSPADDTRKAAEQAQEALSGELHKPVDEPLSALSEKRRLPDPSTFQPGDFLWPRDPSHYIPYGSRPTGTFKQEKAEWEREKQAFLSRVQQDPKASDYDRALAARLEGLSFEQFHDRYVGDGGEGELTARGWIPYIGHVGMVFFKDEKPWVVEAVPGKVRTLPYEDWLKKRFHGYVWHGRVRELTDEQRLRMVVEAIQQESKPYAFFNFHLADDGGFYCSKLMWYALFRASGVALDDDPEPRRFFWYSPKQIFKSRHIQVLYSPGDYGTASIQKPAAASIQPTTPSFDKSLEGKSCEIAFSDCVKACRTSELESCVQSCCCRFGGAACPEAPNCCAP